MISGRLEQRMRPIFGNKVAVQSKYLVLDWSNVTSRAFFVTPDYRFVKTLADMLLNYRKRFTGWTMVVAQEGSSGTDFRKSILPCYKSNRLACDDRTDNISKSSRLLEFLDCVEIKARDGEADDAVASFLKVKANTARVVIVSEDRDLWQLITPMVTVWVRNNQEITPELCVKGLGVLPPSVPMLKALLGDRSDNIPRGVAQVKKHALLRIARASSTPEAAKTMILNADWIPPTDLARFRAGWPQVVQNYSIVKLLRDLVIETKNNKPDPSKLVSFLASNHADGLSKEELDLLAYGK